jgi:hypothetical protein
MSVIEQYRDAAFAGNTPLTEIIQYCKKHISDDPSIRDRVLNLVYHGKIPSLNAQCKNTELYMPSRSEQMIIGLYKNLKAFTQDGKELLDLHKAAKSMRIGYYSLTKLLKWFGRAYLLTTEGVEEKLRLERDTPVIPYVRWTGDCYQKLMIDFTVREMSNHIRDIRKEEPPGRPIYNKRWVEKFVFYITRENMLNN